LVLTEPAVAHRDCKHCQEWLYEESGALALDRQGKPIRRPPGVSTACRTPQGCPKGTPDAMKSLTPQHEKTWSHYKRCRATNHWPDDDLVREHAGLLSTLEQQVEAMRQERMTLLLSASLGIR
jgi:hypothetical protein